MVTHLRYQRPLSFTLLLLLALLMAGCSATPQTKRILEDRPANLPAHHELADVPFYPQELYQCGPAALATVLHNSGVAVTPEELVPRIYVPKRQGSFQVEILAATRQQQRLAYTIAPTLESLLAAIDGGQPVLILQNLGLSWYPQWHYAVVVGYDLERREMVLRSGVERRYVMGLKLFERTWARADYWGMVALKPGELPVDDDGQRYFLAAAAFERNANPAAAERAWRAGVKRWAQRVDLHMGYGNFLYARGNLADAEARFRAAIALHADFAPAHNNLASILLETGRADEAEQVASRAVALGGEHIAVYRETLRKARAGASSGH